MLGNRFVNLPHQSVRIYGNDHTVAGNAFTDSLWETADAGVIYAGRVRHFPAQFPPF